MKTRSDNQTELVETKIKNLWSDPADQESVRKLLGQYASLSYARETPRVHLAILKLSNGSLDELEKMVAAATVDYRDVLAWAEYPGEMATDLSLNKPEELTVDQRRELAEIKRRDRDQYRKWLSD